MIVKALVATVALAVIVIGYLILSVPITQVGNTEIAIFPGVTLNGLSLAGFVSNQYALWGAAIVLSIVAVIIWLVAAANSDESDTQEF